MNNFEIARTALMRNMGRTIRDLREQIAIAESWADNRPDAPPLDCEPQRVALHYALKVYNAAERREGPIPAEWIDAMISALNTEEV